MKTILRVSPFTSCSPFLINLILVYLSKSVVETFKFISSGRRPDCLHFLKVLENDNEQEGVLMKIAAMLPEKCVFFFATNTNESSFLKERIPSEMIFKGAEEFKKKFFPDKIELIELINANERNPLKVSEWVSNSLDSSFLHVPKFSKFPECLESDRLGDLEILKNWNFTALNRESDELLRLTFRVFEDFGLLKEFGVSADRFKLFLLAVNCNYFDNPYHNFSHVVDVLQCCYYLLKNASDGRIPSLLGPIHVFSLLIGCLCHDLGHPSFGNTFLKDSEHPLAILFNDSSVLENYHAMVLFSILRCPFYNWTCCDNEGACFPKSEFRKCVLGCILGTDMSNHFDFIKQFDEKFPNLKNDSVLELKQYEKIQLATALIKCSDISNVLRPFSIAKSWGVALLSEFFHQGDYEKVLGLPVGPLNDRKTLKIAPAQHQFLTVVAAPLYRSVAAKIDGLECFDQWIHENSQNWMNYQE